MGIIFDKTHSTLHAFQVHHLLTFHAFQVRRHILRYKCINEKYKTHERGELRIHEINERCSLSNSKVDISFVSSKHRQLLGLIQGKLGNGDIKTKATIHAIYQAVCYSLLTLTYSLWGALKKWKVDEISSLVVFPKRLYRLKFQKLDEPFGISLAIEHTADEPTMNHVLDEYVDQCKLMECKLASDESHALAEIDPRDWSPVNHDFEAGVSNKFFETTKHNLGLLFRSKVSTVKDFAKNRHNRALFCLQYPPDDQQVLVKYLCPLLDLDFASSISSIDSIIKHTREKQHVNHAFKDAVNLIKAFLPRASEDGAISRALERHTQDTLSDVCLIKHPYIGRITYGINSSLHSILVMVDSGPTLATMMRDERFMIGWSESSFREAFLTDVGYSALNLEELELCHNDIRPPNITVQGGRFCLIDFDNSRQSPAFGDSPVLDTLTDEGDRRMMFSVAQIGLVVYSIHLHGSLSTKDNGPNKDALRNVTKWFYGVKPVGDIDHFQRWASERGLTAVFPQGDGGPPTVVRAPVGGAGLAGADDGPGAMGAGGGIFGRPLMDLMLRRMLELPCPPR